MEYSGVISDGGAADLPASFVLPAGAPPRATAVPSIIAPLADVAEPVWAPALDFDERPRSEVANRVVNVAIASAALIALAPVFVLVGFAIRLTSRGPIVYRQIRVGVDRRRHRIQAVYDRRHVNMGGRIFMMYKFRSMTVDAEKNGIVWAQKVDSRVTSIGRFLRLTRLDELPQLINVLRGDMNIVGPRQERPSIFFKLREEIDAYALRQRAKPGITGLAQINRDYDNSIADVRKKVEYDLEYIRQQSLASDLRIMLRTVPVMLFRKGAR